MAAVAVRYELKPECMEEHLELIQAVFDELAAKAPHGVHYGVMRSADGHSFTHITNPETDEAGGALGQLDSFQAFVANIGERCTVPPAPVEQIHVQNHGLFA